MPAKSKKQFRFMKAQQNKKNPKVSKKVSAEYTEDVPYKSLPEAVGKKVDEAKAKAAKRKPKRKGK